MKPWKLKRAQARQEAQTNNEAHRLDGAVVVDPDYSKSITVNGVASVSKYCMCVGTFTPHQPLSNGKCICGLCGTEH